jgi:glycosyltransferase involved in cell wall biosynthesis
LQEVDQYKGLGSARCVRPLGDSNGQCGLRLIIDARKLLDGGIGRYINNLLSGFVAAEFFSNGTFEKVGVILSPAGAKAVTSSEQSALFSAWAGKVEIYCDKAKPYSIDEYVNLARRLPLDSYHVFHSPHYTLPFGIGIPSVVTVHDVLHITHPQSWYYPLIAKRLVASALSRASKLITVSAASAMELQRLDLLSEASARSAVEVIPNAATSLKISDEPRVLQAPYLLAVISTDKPHKGLPALLEAYQRYRGLMNEPCRLCLIGAGVVKAADKIMRSAPGVEVMGKVDEKTYQALFAGAQSVVVASLGEGFCIPFIEAHACGVPVVYRPVPALRELHVANFDVMARDVSVASLCEAMIEVGARPARTDAQKQAVKQGVDARYAPEIVAERTLQVYWQAVKTGVGSTKRTDGSKLRVTKPGGLTAKRRAVLGNVASRFSDARKQRLQRNVAAKRGKQV